MKRMITTALALVVGPPAAGGGVAEPVVEAEAAFARAVAAKGTRDGFADYAAPDAIMFADKPVPARGFIASWPDDPEGAPPLDWWPDFAGMARSGDFGFSTGPATSPVRYMTVWQKQPDGRWKWIYDGGANLPAPAAGGKPKSIRFLPAATAEAGSAARAMAEIGAVETKLAAAAAKDAPAAYRALIAEGGILAGSLAWTEPGGQAAEIERRGATMALQPLGGSASAAGDMAFTYGVAAWTESGHARRGHYARVWQRSPAGWRLAMEALIAPRPKPQPAG